MAESNYVNNVYGVITGRVAHGGHAVVPAQTQPFHHTYMFRIARNSFTRLTLDHIHRVTADDIEKNPHAIRRRLFVGHIPFEEQHRSHVGLERLFEYASGGRVVVDQWIPHSTPGSTLDHGCATAVVHGCQHAIERLTTVLNGRVFLVEPFAVVFAHQPTGDRDTARWFANVLCTLFRSPATYLTGQRLVVEESDH